MVFDPVRFGEIFLGGSCTLCGQGARGPGRGHGGICEGCLAALDPTPAIPSPPGLDECRALTGYTGVGRSLVTGLKFKNRRGAVSWMAGRLGELIAGDRIDVITWAPTSPARRRERGFDQAEVLARRIGRAAGLPVSRCLVRLPGQAQTGRHRDERIRGPRFDARRGIRAAVDGRRVALVDDVVTTGATMSRAADTLRAGGACAVIGVAIARTPPSMAHR